LEKDKIMTELNKFKKKLRLDWTKLMKIGTGLNEIMTCDNDTDLTYDNNTDLTHDTATVTCHNAYLTRGQLF